MDKVSCYKDAVSSNDNNDHGNRDAISSNYNYEHANRDAVANNEDFKWLLRC